MSVFYILYFQDCGYAAVGCAVTVRNVSSPQEAKRIYPDVVRSQGYACTAEMNPGGAEGSLLRFEQVPDWLAKFSDAEIHDYYNEPKPCDFIKDGRCSVSTCGSTEVPYGCYTKTHAEWKAKWDASRPPSPKSFWSRLRAWK